MCNFIFLFGIILLHLDGTITTATILDDHNSEDPVAKYTAELNDHEIDEEAERNKAAVFRAENMLLIGKSALEVGDFDRALLCFNKAYIHQPFNAENLAARAYCHLKMENFYLSFLDANEALKLEPLSRWAQTTKVHSLIGSERHNQAILHAIEQFHDKELIAHLLEQYKFTLVERGASNAIDPVAILKMVVDSKDYFDKNNFSKTVELVEQILPHLPYNETLFKGSMAIRMVSLKALERLPEAYMDATELLELDNSSEMMLYLHNTLADLLTGLGRFEAIAEIERGIKAFPNKDKIAESLKQLSKAKMDMSRKYDTILDDTPSGIPSAGRKITELVIGPTQYQVTSADGKKYVAEYDSLEEFLQSYHSKITLLVLVGIPFDSEFLGVLASVDDLWTGNFRFDKCDFTQLKEDEIMELFRNTIRPEYMMFISNIGLTSQILNKAIKDQILDCDLAIVDDRKDQIQLDPNALLEFLHRPVPKNGKRKRNFLSLQSEFIEGGILAFVEQITEHFKTDSDPVSFHLQITQDVEFPFYGEKPLENPWTGEFLAQKKQRYTETVTYTTLDRYHPT